MTNAQQAFLDSQRLAFCVMQKLRKLTKERFSWGVHARCLSIPSSAYAMYAEDNPKLLAQAVTQWDAVSGRHDRRAASKLLHNNF